EKLNSYGARHPERALEIQTALAQGYVNCYWDEMALQTVGPLLERQPDDWRLYLWRGKVRERNHQDEKALEDYRQAVELNSLCPFDLERRIAETLHRLGRSQEAAATYEGLRHRRPYDRDVLLGLARCLYELARLEDC